MSVAFPPKWVSVCRGKSTQCLSEAWIASFSKCSNLYICMSWWNMNAAACKEPKEAQYKFHMRAFESIKCGIRKTLRSQLLDNSRIKPFFRDVNSSKSWIPILYNIQRNMMQQSQSALRATVSLSAASWLQWATSQKQECIPRIEKKRERTGYWLCSTPKWALWFSAVSHQLSEQCAANKKHFINIPSGRSPLPVNIVPRRVLAAVKMHSGSSSANRLLPAAHGTVLK